MAWPVRYKLIGLLTTGSMINYADRVNISVAAPVMMAAIGWDEARFGVIFSAFLAGYMLLQLPGGIIADRWNACRVIAWACVGFSVFTVLTPFGVAAYGLMLAIRFCVGMFESVSFPAYASLNSRWIPRTEYSRAQTLSVAGSYLGQVISPYDLASANLLMAACFLFQCSGWRSLAHRLASVCHQYSG
jgi:MFS family permease